MATNNAINARSEGIVRYQGAGVFDAITTTLNRVQIGASGNGLTSLASGNTGQMLQSNGSSSAPGFSTATYPSTAGTTGTIMRSNGTNWVNTTATYPASTTINQILYSTANNAIGQITTGVNMMLITNASGVPSFGVTLTNDFVVTSSTAGSQRTLTLQHTNNSNTGSSAFMTISVGGTSAGSPFTQYAVGSTQSYASGIDNADSQSYVINSGSGGGTTPGSGTRVLRISTTGNVTKPANSCCGVTLTTGLTNLTGDGTFYTPVIFETETSPFFDQNSNYNPATGIFTAPVAGKYQVNAQVTFTNLGAAHTSGYLVIYANGGNFWANIINPYVNSVGGEATFCISGILALAATNTVNVAVQVAGGTKTVGLKGAAGAYYSSFSVCLVS